MPKQQAGHAPMLQKPPCRQTAGWFSAARPVAVRCLFLARRYNTLDFAIPAIKRRSRSLATLGDCKQSLSLVRQAGPHAKSCANRDAARPYWMTQRGLRPLKATDHSTIRLWWYARQRPTISLLYHTNIKNTHSVLQDSINCQTMQYGSDSTSQKPSLFPKAGLSFCLPLLTI